MDWLGSLLAFHGKWFGIDWHFWKVVGWTGNAVFFSRFVVQWYVTEQRRQVVVPVAFWWLSLAGAWLLFAYALFYQRDSVFIFAYAFTWIPYIRNLMIHHRHLRAQRSCPACQQACLPQASYCSQCGQRLEGPAARVGG